MMTRRLAGNYGVDAVGVVDEKKEKTKRTPRDAFVLGPAVRSMLDDIARADQTTRSESLRTLIVNEHKKRGLG